MLEQYFFIPNQTFNSKYKFWLIILLIILNSCAKLPSVAYSKINSQHYNPNFTINNINNWRLKSKIHFFNSASNNQANLVAYMDWLKSQDHSLIKFSSYWHTQALTIKIDNKFPLKNIEILEQQSSPELSKIFKENLRFLLNSDAALLPLNYLHYWLLGVPCPQLPYKNYPTGFIQNNWLITYNNFKPSVGKQTIIFPSRINVEYIGKDLINKIKIKVINQSLEL